MPAPTTDYPTPVIGDLEPPIGLIFPTDGTGFQFDAGYPLTFPPDPPANLAALFPTIMPEVEQIVYQAVNDACHTRVMFPDGDQGVPTPCSFSLPPQISLFVGKDSTYTIPVGQNAGAPIPEIPVVRGWPAYPGQVPAIGVAESTSPEDQAEETTQGGFAGDVYATDKHGNVLATCAYYAEPLRITVVVELIHENRDERDRLHDQLRRVLFPLKHTIPAASAQIRDVHVSTGEKQDLPVDEQPRTIYVSLFTIEANVEALIPTEIVPGGVVEQLTFTVTETPIPFPTNPDAIPSDIYN